MNMEYEHEHGIMTSTLFANHCKRSNNQAALKAKNDEIGFFDLIFEIGFFKQICRSFQVFILYNIGIFEV